MVVIGITGEGLAVEEAENHSRCWLVAFEVKEKEEEEVEKVQGETSWRTREVVVIVVVAVIIETVINGV